MNAQYVEPAVSKAKFEREIQEYRQLERDYLARGWFLIEANFPRLLVLLTAPQVKPPAVVTGVEFEYSNYDAEPPSVHLVNPFTGAPFALKELPTVLPRSIRPMGAPVLAGPAGQMLVINQVAPLMQAYSPDEIPFLCIAGVREYHQNPAHTGDSWLLHRHEGAGRFVRILEVISAYGVQPIAGYAVTLTPQVTGFATRQVE